MRLFAPIFILACLISFTLHAEEKKGKSVCEILLDEHHVDEEARYLAIKVYNRLVSDFEAIEQLEKGDESDYDIVATFNERTGLPSLPPSHRTYSAKLTMVSPASVDVEEHNGPVSHGIVPRENKILEESQRTEVLGRLSVMAEKIGDISDNGGFSDGEFARVYRGKAAIKKFLDGLGGGLRRQLVRPPDYDNWFPSSALVTGGMLEAIWAFPGKSGLDFVDGMVNVTNIVNSGLAHLLARYHQSIPFDLPLSQQWAYTVAAGGVGLALLINDTKNYLVERFRKPPEGSAFKEIPTTPIGAQFELVGWTLHDVAYGKYNFKKNDLMTWATNYKFTDDDGDKHDMAFDLVLFVDQGDPVLLVTNREN